MGAQFPHDRLSIAHQRVFLAQSEHAHLFRG
jgi:hypothetical protein